MWVSRGHPPQCAPETPLFPRHSFVYSILPHEHDHLILWNSIRQTKLCIGVSDLRRLAVGEVGGGRHLPHPTKWEAWLLSIKFAIFQKYISLQFLKILYYCIFDRQEVKTWATPSRQLVRMDSSRHCTLNEGRHMI